MHASIEWVSGILGAIGPENIGLFIVFASMVGTAVWRGIRTGSKVGEPSVEPVSKRLDRIELEHDQLEERQVLSDSRLSRIEGQVGVLQTLIIGRNGD